MIYVVPSRGRPQSVNQMIGSWEATRVIGELFFALDIDDPTIKEYEAALAQRPAWVHFGIANTHTMIESLNNWAYHLAAQYEHLTIGFMGDDHRPRTFAWDARIDACVNQNSGGIATRYVVYANDSLQGANLPTQVAMPAAWIRALGKMVPKELTHLYADNYWKMLGERLGRLQYLPDVIIEHMHPVAGKAEWDDGYKRVNGGNIYNHDAEAFARYVAENHLADDVTKIQTKGY